jgi:ferric-dicitrate binding protein FerR (iron transport regulator)
MAYENENGVHTTLLEGAVRVNASHNRVVIKPDQQADVTDDGKIAVKEVIAEDAIAWKKGLFYFDSTGIPGVMRQLTRWYDVEVKYEGTVSRDHLTGTVSRNSSLSKVMEMLAINNIKCKLEGKTLIISAK